LEENVNLTQRLGLKLPIQVKKGLDIDFKLTLGRRDIDITIVTMISLRKEQSFHFTQRISSKRTISAWLPAAARFGI